MTARHIKRIGAQTNKILMLLNYSTNFVE